MHLIITIIIATVFFILLAQAILETIWGTICLIWGLFLYAISYLLDFGSFIARTGKKIINLFRKPKPVSRRDMLARAIYLHLSNTK